MAKVTPVKPVVAAIGAAFIAGMAMTPVANAAENPFATQELSSGYQQQLAEAKCGESKAAEAKCGESKAAEAKCGESKKAEAEGKCGESKKAEAEGKCGESKKAEAEGKCGEAKCGANK